MLNKLNHLAHRIEQTYDRLKWAVRTQLGIGPVEILPYPGYGTRTHVTLLGRVLGDHTATPATEADTIWRNAGNTLRRFNTHEIPYARVQARLHGQTAVGQANDEGYFQIDLALREPLPADEPWHEVELTLVDPPGRSTGPVTARVLVPPAEAEFGVISDLDDTVIQTNVLSVLQAARNTFLHNAYTRLAFPGVAAFYQALHHGTQESANPIYYVSNMPWNLYDLMRDFFAIRHIPHGPMFLTDLGLTDSHFVRRPGRQHKRDQIDRLLTTYPDLPFILIGDAGEEDPAIYYEAVQNYEGRIKAIYIRDVPGSEHQAAIEKLIAEAARLDVALVLVPDTLAAARHAAAHGFIQPKAVEVIAAEIEIEEEGG